MANKVYADENRSDSNKLGNTQQGDGYKFRGRGIKQLTGRSNYANFQSYYNKHNPNDTKDFLNNEEHRKALPDNGKIALLSAVWFWNDKKCYKIADKQTSNNANEIVKQITKKVNGGYNGLDKRTKQHTRIKNANIFEDF
ncbi:glycoside hydrolase [Helicobacter trogontum]|uniref:Glycoside hydrolase n=2 Tax=Helicobacter trogontum TaxID=50960 RepID=A0A4U8S2F5_9HELI|nr:glycoside hydrolase [Helicobacter trogontum]